MIKLHSGVYMSSSPTWFHNTSTSKTTTWFHNTSTSKTTTWCHNTSTSKTTTWCHNTSTSKTTTWFHNTSTSKTTHKQKVHDVSDQQTEAAQIYEGRSKFCNFDMKYIIVITKFQSHLLFFGIVSCDVNALLPLFWYAVYALKKEFSILPFKPHFSNSFQPFIICKPGPTKIRFQISEQTTVTRNQIWTVGRVVQLKKSTVVNSLLCNKWLVNWAHCCEEAKHSMTISPDVSDWWRRTI